MLPWLEILISLLAAVASMLGAGIVRSDFFEKLLRKLLKRPAPEQGHAERLSRLMQSLQASSAEIDEVLAELAKVASDRNAAVAQLEQQLRALEAKEQSIQERIAHLEKVPIPVAEYLAQVASAGERRSAHRDYMLFGAGVLASTLVSILFFILQSG